MRNQLLGLLVEQMTFEWTHDWPWSCQLWNFEIIYETKEIFCNFKIHLQILGLDKPLNFSIRKKQGRRGKLFYHKFWFHQQKNLMKSCWHDPNLQLWLMQLKLAWQKTIKHVIHIHFWMYVIHIHLLGVVAQWVQALKWIPKDLGCLSLLP